jgi:hypothetical protein
VGLLSLCVSGSCLLVCVGLLWPCVSGCVEVLSLLFWGFSRTPFFLLNIKDTQLSCVFEKKKMLTVMTQILQCKTLGLKLVKESSSNSIWVLSVFIVIDNMLHVFNLDIYELFLSHRKCRFSQ